MTFLIRAWRCNGFVVGGDLQLVAVRHEPVLAELDLHLAGLELAGDLHHLALASGAGTGVKTALTLAAREGGSGANRLCRPGNLNFTFETVGQSAGAVAQVG